MIIKNNNLTACTVKYMPDKYAIEVINKLESISKDESLSFHQKTTNQYAVDNKYDKRVTDAYWREKSPPHSKEEGNLEESLEKLNLYISRQPEKVQNMYESLIKNTNPHSIFLNAVPKSSGKIMELKCYSYFDIITGGLVRQSGIVYNLWLLSNLIIFSTDEFFVLSPYTKDFHINMGHKPVEVNSYEEIEASIRIVKETVTAVCNACRNVKSPRKGGAICMSSKEEEANGFSIALSQDEIDKVLSAISQGKSVDDIFKKK